MITRFHIENFKSLRNFDLSPAGQDIAPFTCLIGLNGSGKSTLLQALDFAAHVVTGKVEDWLVQRNWNPADVRSNLGKGMFGPSDDTSSSSSEDTEGGMDTVKRAFVVRFDVSFKDRSGNPVRWRARYNTRSLRCTHEEVESNSEPLLRLDGGQLSLPDASGALRHEKLNFLYKGSVLSTLELKNLPPLLSVVKETLGQLKSLELLSPQLLRKRANAAEDIGLGGEKLSAFLAGFGPFQKLELLAKLKEFYPHLESWRVRSLRAGWKDLSIVERYQESHPVQAIHVNDGLLRIMAILAQGHSPHTILLFDEIENGINPELVEKLVDFLIHCGKQVLVTTHSPMILNYIPDEIAKPGVVFLYKTKRGETRSARFFDSPAMERKLRVLGPGEVFADTRLSDLAGDFEQQAADHPAGVTS